MTPTSEPRPVPAETLDRLAAWARRKPRFALMGEFSSGKSTLLNLLIGEDLLPTRVTATELPPVWFSHGPRQAFWVDRRGARHPLGFGEFGGVPRSARYVRVLTPAPLLERCDIIDTPGISDPNLDEESWRFPVGQANFVLWCTPATQAWRETERSMWLSLPERLRTNSTLVVTRADKLATPGDRDKVARRLQRESFGLFGGLVFLSSLEAVRGQALLRQTGDGGLWVRSGGAELESRIDWGLAAVRAERLDLLERYRSTGPRPAVVPAVARPTAEAPPASGDTGAPLRLVQPWEPVRPRRVELPDNRRTERPAHEPAPDPLGEIRAGWMALRAAEGERPEPATVLRLSDPILRREGEEPPSPETPAAGPQEPLAAWAGPGDVETPEEEPRPAAWPEAEVEAAPEMAVAEEPPTAPPPSPEENGEEAPTQEDHPAGQDAEPDALADEPPAGTPEPPLPRAVRVWRAIVASTPEIPPNSPILAMIDQLLCELSREDEPSDENGPASATIIERNRAA